MRGTYPLNTPKKRIAVSSAKAKGRKFQQWVRDNILSRFEDLEPDDVKSTSSGVNGEDVQLSPAARKQIPISVECKAKARIAVYSDYAQATANAPTNMEPILFMKADRQKPLAIMDASYFLDLMRKVNDV